jgi:predicted membrane-bound spermidine synthase
VGRKARKEVGEMRRKPAAKAAKASGRHIRYFAVLAFLSGSAALTYQVLWVRQLGTVVGVDVYAVTACVSAFFAGLALGGLLFGRWGDRFSRPLRDYGLLELAIALCAVLATVVLSESSPLFVSLQQKAGAVAWILPFAFVGIPAFLVGGTLPLLFRAWAPESQIPRGGGLIYAANTAGGIAGALLTPFFFIGHFGLRGTSLVAALLNLSVAAFAFSLQRKMEVPDTKRLSADPEPANSLPNVSLHRTALVLYGVAGVIAMGYEVVWSQAIVPFMSTRSFAFAVVLATYLAGLMLGSAIAARYAERLRDPWGVFGLLISAAGILAFLQVVALGHWLLVLQTRAEALVLDGTGSIFAGMCARFAVAAGSVVFAPTLLLGAAFPLVLRLTVGARQIARDLGEVLASNTLGGIAGTLLTGFVLVPWLGIVRTLATLALAAAVVGMVAVFRGHAVRPLARKLVVATAVVALIAGVWASPRRIAEALTVARGGGQVIFYQESAAGTVAVLQDKGDFRRLYIQGVSNSGDAMPSLRYMRLQALLPLLIMDQDPKSVLVIGYGTGITAGALLAYPSLEKRVCVELLPGVIQASPLFHGNFSAATDPRMQIRTGDGRQELLRSDEKYDLITLEPPPPSATGVANLYSTDFYRIAAKRLETGGILAQWLPLGAQNEEDTRAIIRSFLDGFPNASLWSTELHEMLLVGSRELLVLNAERIAQRFQQSEVEAALREVGINSPAALLATWVTDRHGLEQFARNARAVSDDRPSIEYSTWVRPGEVTRVLPELIELSTEPPLQGASKEFQDALADEQDRLGGFYQAALAAYRGERDLWARSIRHVLAADAHNPYYNWTLGGQR